MTVRGSLLTAVRADSLHASPTASTTATSGDAASSRAEGSTQDAQEAQDAEAADASSDDGPYEGTILEADPGCTMSTHGTTLIMGSPGPAVHVLSKGRVSMTGSSLFYFRAPPSAGEGGDAPEEEPSRYDSAGILVEGDGSSACLVRACMGPVPCASCRAGPWEGAIEVHTACFGMHITSACSRKLLGGLLRVDSWGGAAHRRRTGAMICVP